MGDKPPSSRATGKRKRNNSDSSAPSTSSAAEEISSVFQCPVCYEYMVPPIIQCHDGHLLCQKCRPKVSCCPTCHGPLGDIRNIAMEKVAYRVRFPCKYTNNGCRLSLLVTEKELHEEICKFRLCQCPCPGTLCKWEGTLLQVIPHISVVHKAITALQGEDVDVIATNIYLPIALDWVMIQSCFNCSFMLMIQKREKIEGYPQFFAQVKIIGSRKEAERFTYKLELTGQKRRLLWKAGTRSILEGAADVNKDCLVFDMSMAKLFSVNSNLEMNVTISMA